MFFAPVTSYVGVGDGNFVGSGLFMGRYLFVFEIQVCNVFNSSIFLKSIQSESDHVLTYLTTCCPFTGSFNVNAK